MILKLLKLSDTRKIDMQNSHTEVLKNMAIASSAQGDSLRELAEKTHKDSRSIKTLTFIAMVYLPASLVAVSCLSNIVVAGAIH